MRATASTLFLAKRPPQHEPAHFGGESRELLLNQIKQFYSDEDEQKYGVVGIRIERDIMLE